MQEIPKLLEVFRGLQNIEFLRGDVRPDLLAGLRGFF
jgi:hypothetical protein